MISIIIQSPKDPDSVDKIISILLAQDGNNKFEVIVSTDQFISKVNEVIKRYCTQIFIRSIKNSNGNLLSYNEKINENKIINKARYSKQIVIEATNFQEIEALNESILKLNDSTTTLNRIFMGFQNQKKSDSYKKDKLNIHDIVDNFDHSMFVHNNLENIIKSLDERNLLLSFIDKILLKIENNLISQSIIRNIFRHTILKESVLLKAMPLMTRFLVTDQDFNLLFCAAKIDCPKKMSLNSISNEKFAEYINLINYKVVKFNDDTEIIKWIKYAKRILSPVCKKTLVNFLNQIFNKNELNGFVWINFWRNLKIYINSSNSSKSVYLHELLMKTPIKSLNNQLEVKSILALIDDLVCYNLDSLFHDVLNLAPKDLNGSCKDLFNAHLLAWRGDYEKALPLLEKSYEEAEYKSDFANLIAFCAEKSGDYQKAAKFYKVLADYQNNSAEQTSKERLAQPALIAAGDINSAMSVRMNDNNRIMRYFEQKGLKIWDGKINIHDKKLLVICDQGIGDEVKYSNYYRMLKNKCRRISITCDPRLYDIFSRSISNVNFVPMPRFNKQFDKEILDTQLFNNIKEITNFKNNYVQLIYSTILALPDLFREFQYVTMASSLPFFFLPSEKEYFPMSSGFLKANPDKKEKWSKLLKDIPLDSRIGIYIDGFKSIAKRHVWYSKLIDWKEIINDHRYVLFLLQGHNHEYLTHELPKDICSRIAAPPNIDLHNDIEELSAFISNMAVIISPNCMIKELAGSLNIPVMFYYITKDASIIARRSEHDNTDKMWQSIKHYSVPGSLEKTINQICKDLPVPAKKVPQKSIKPFLLSEAYSKANAEINNKEKNTTVPKRKTDAWDIEEKFFYEVNNHILNANEQPLKPKGAVFIGTQQGMKYLALTALLAHELKSRSWATIYIDDQTLKQKVPHQPELKKIVGGFIKQEPVKGQIEFRFSIRGKEDNHLQHEWIIDWENKVVSCEGINYYCVFYERLGKLFRRFTIDLSNPDQRQVFQSWLINADHAISFLNYIYDKIANSSFPVRFIAPEANYVPYGIFVIFCREKGYKQNMHFITLSEAYQNYASGGKMQTISKVVYHDITSNPDKRAPFLPTRKQFQDWKKSNECEHLFKNNFAISILNKNRKGKQINTNDSVMLERLHKHKEQGKKIVCLFGKITYDLCLWEDYGFVHNDLKHWVNDTVQALKDSETLLLIKSHPAEANTEYFSASKQHFSELIETELNSNMILLEPTMFNIYEIAPYIDAGVMWMGSSGIELTARGIPAIYGSKWGKKDYPINMFYPKNILQYHDWLNRPNKLEVSKNDQIDAQKYIIMQALSVNGVEFDAALLGEKIKFTGPPQWDLDIVKKALVGKPPKYVKAMINDYFK